MRVFIKDYLLPWLFVIVFWVAIWGLVPGKEKNLSLPNVLSVFVLLPIFLLGALCFVGKTLERYGYSRGDIRRLPEIIEKTHGKLYPAKEIFDTIASALVFWGLFSTAVLLTENPLWGVINALAMFALIFSFFVLLISMVIWVVVFPLSLYRIFTDKEPHRGLIDFVVEYNLVLTGILLAVRLIALHAGDISAPHYIMKLIAFGRNGQVVNALFELSALNFLFGLVGFYGPRRIGKGTALILTLIVLGQLWVAWGLLFG
ncbi:hypothetical membrane protein, conserved [Thermococcus onnurineus NA1]|uniref:Hypothetical membrane protein, conserved n=1 Tax=Thermococcus onnurineus (strain NA1) TaxID=523850 RepID=B6YV63_THEON|nr:hypothetical protein [Thermococcus onnurineus]ACJ17291.1 hypothetical membrane protein, conserved [Thermococcus onnurineus NA1]